MKTSLILSVIGTVVWKSHCRLPYFVKQVEMKERKKEEEHQNQCFPSQSKLSFHSFPSVSFSHVLHHRIILTNALTI